MQNIVLHLLVSLTLGSYALLNQSCSLIRKSDKGTVVKNETGAASGDSVFSSAVDGIWVRMDNGSRYVLAGSTVKVLGTTDSYAYVEGDGSSSTFSNGPTTLTLTQKTDTLAKIETKTGDKTTSFNLVRIGKEDLKITGNFQLPDASSLRLTEADEEGNVEYPYLLLENADRADLSYNIVLKSNEQFEVSDIEQGTYNVHLYLSAEDEPLNLGQQLVDDSNEKFGNIIVHDQDYNFKTSLKATGYHFSMTSYEDSISIRNIGQKMSNGVNYKLTSLDPELVIDGSTAGILDTLTPDMEKELKVNYHITSIQDQSKDLRLGITLRDVNGTEWTDEVTIKAWKQSIPITLDVDKGTGIYGVVNFNEKYEIFTVQSGHSSVMRIPALPNTTYTFALGSTSLSAESRYSIAVAPLQETDFSKFFDTSTNEPDNDLEHAVALKLLETSIAYVHIGDIDFRTFTLGSDIFPKGTATEADPFQISNATDLAFAELFYEPIKSTKLYMKLTGDVDLKNSRPLYLDLSNLYFDGGNHTIKSLTSSWGLFSNLSGTGAISNLVLDDFHIITEAGPVGALISTMSPTGKNSYTMSYISVINSEIKTTYDRAYKDQTDGAGGLVGSAGNLNLDHISVMSTTVSGDSVAGGIAGWLGGNLSVSKVSGVKVTGYTGNESGSTVGGVVGKFVGGTADRTYATDCTASGKEAGGLFGFTNYSDVFNTYSNCEVTGHYIAGGLIGIYWTSTIKHSYSTGTVLAGNIYTLKVKGGLIGEGGTSVINCYWDMESSGLSTSSYGPEVGQTTAAMKTLSTFSGWDFNIWTDPMGTSYPTLGF